MKTFVKICVVCTVSFGLFACLPVNKDGELEIEVKVEEQLVEDICNNEENQEAAAAIICMAANQIIEEHGGIREMTRQSMLGVCDAIIETGTVVVVAGACEIVYTINEAKCGMQSACSGTWEWLKAQCGFGPEVGSDCEEGDDDDDDDDNDKGDSTQINKIK